MSVTQLPDLDPSSPTFRADVDTFFRSRIQAFVSEVNALAANLNSIAAGGAYAIPYTYNWKALVGTSGGGVLAHNDPFYLLNATDYLYLDLNSAGARSVAALINEMDDSTSAIRGKIRIEKVGDPNKWALFDVIGPSVHSANHSAIRVAWTAASASPNPFTQGEQLILFFQRTGDKGDLGSLPSMLIRDQKASGATAQNLPGGVWTKRAHNTVVHNSIPGASLSNDEAVLPIGTYLIDSVAPAAAGATHQARLFNVTDNALYDVGTSEGLGAGQASVSRSVLQTVLVVSGATKRYRVDHFANNTVSGGLPVSSGASEVYTQTSITKIA